MSTEAQLKTLYNHLKFKFNSNDTEHFQSCNHKKKWLPYQILSGKTVKNAQIDQQTTDIHMVDKAKFYIRERVSL